jgi:hypothetical protein
MVKVKEKYFKIKFRPVGGHAVTQWLRHCTTNRKVTGSIPNGVTGFFLDIILLVTLWPLGRLGL